jgi:prophage regulatory protein
MTTTQTTPGLLRVSGLMALLGAGRTTVWRWRHAGLLPPPFQLGPRTVAWRSSEVARWLRDRPLARPGQRGRQLFQDPPPPRS